MATESYDLGDMRRMPAAFTDIDGNPADPTDVTFRMREPDGTVTSYVYGVDGELIRDSLGNFHVDWLYAQEGRHFCDFTGSGVVQAVAHAEIHIHRSGTA